MILVGDIGGTKTVLALYSCQNGSSNLPILETRFESKAYKSLEEIIRTFLDQTNAKPISAIFGVAGPVKNRQAKVTNLPWSINADTIGRSFSIAKVLLLNDLEAIATAVPHLCKEDLLTLNRGFIEPQGNIAIIAPGTGLGTAFLIWTGTRYKACASEGGHTSFAPRNSLEMELLTFLQQQYSHVSFERICSGGQLANIYDFFIHSGTYTEPDWLQEKMRTTPDRTPVIVEAALKRQAAICEATLDLFVHSLGTVISNMAVSLLPTGGIYLGGGIPPRITDRLQQADFMHAITDKGRFSEFCSHLPINVILSPKVALYGAACYGIEAMNNT